MATGPNHNSTAILLLVFVYVNAFLFYFLREFVTLPEFWTIYSTFGLFGTLILGYKRPVPENLLLAVLFVVLLATMLIFLNYSEWLVAVGGLGGFFAGIMIRAMITSRSETNV